MSERLALLIGVNAYRLDNIRDLPIALDDVAVMERSLRTSGYVVTSVTGASGGQPPSRGVIRDEVRQFLASAPEGSTALVYFSGHGVHLSGTDYLLPWDAPDSIHEGTADDLLPADLARMAGQELDRCPAATIVLAVDACRDEVPPAKSPLNEFGCGLQSEPSRRRVYTLFACTNDATAAFDKQLGSSVFTFALAEAMRAETAPSTLGEVVAFVRTRMADLCREHGLPPQEPAYRLDVDGGSGADRVICSSPANDPTAAELRRAFTSLGGADQSAASGLDELARRSIELIRESSRRRLSDVWLDPDLPRRTVDAANLLFGHAAVMRDAPADERLLVTGLLLAVDVALRCAVAFGEEPAYRHERERISGRYPSLDRRRGYLTERGSTTAAHSIDAWLEHRAALAVPDLWAAEPFTELLELLATHVEVRPAHRAELVGILSAIAVEVVAGLPPRRRPNTVLVVNDHSPPGHQLDVRRIALAVRLVRAMSADLRVYGEPIVQEIGLRTGLDATVAAQEITGLTWLVDNDGRMLLPSIRCSEPAVDQVVRNLAADVRTVLTASADVLHDVLDISDRDVQPCRIGEHPAYVVPLPVITLDTAAVRQLLIGKDLYGSPEVVVRELYQNALDACRYRAVRERYLDLTTPGRPAGWTGRIDLRVHELDDGALVLDCVDTGVGMGDVEVDHAFTAAGRRFTDLPSYRDEADQWAATDPALRLYPNSRFGIGVFSYFMLAEEVEVFTVRHDPRGSVRPGLALHLSAVSGLVAKRPLKPGTPEHAAVALGGTLVRLHLDRAEWESLGKSLVQLVEYMLGYAEFAVAVSDGGDSTGWPAGSLIGDLAAAFPAFECGVTRGWWIDKAVPLLSDGIRLSTTTTGYLVNLCGPQQPRLHVSRNVVDRWPVDWVRDELAAATRELRAWPEFCLAYLWRLTTSDPELAEAVYRRLGPGWLPIFPGDQRYPELDEDIAHVGVFPADHYLLDLDMIGPAPVYEVSYSDDDEVYWSQEAWTWAQMLACWRGHAWEPWQVFPNDFETDSTSPLRARANNAPERWGRPAPSPLDSTLLAHIVTETSPSRPEAVQVTLPRFLSGARVTGLPFLDALRRLLRFAPCDIQPTGFPALPVLAALPSLTERFPAAVHLLTGWGPDTSNSVQVLLQAEAGGIPATDVGVVAEALGYSTLASRARTAGRPPSDLRTIAPYFVDFGDHLIDRVARLSRPGPALEWIAACDRAFAERVQKQLPLAALRQQADPLELRVWSSDNDGIAPWLSGPVSWRTILRKAHLLKQSVAQIVQVLAAYPCVELPPDAVRLASSIGRVADRAAGLLSLKRAPTGPGDRTGPVSALLMTRRNEKSSAAKLKAELAAFRSLGVLPEMLLAKPTWPSLSDRDLDLIEAWENLLGEDEVCGATPRPLSVVETLAFVDAVRGDLHKVLAEMADLDWCGLRSVLDLTESPARVDHEDVALGVFLHRGWEPRLALAALSVFVGTGFLRDDNKWWLAQCPEGAPLTAADIEPANSEIDYDASLALVAATRQGSATAPDIRVGDLILTAARAQVSVGAVAAACRQLAFEIPELTCDPEYHPDWTDAALAALLLATPAPPVEADLGLLGELVAAPAEEVRARLVRFGLEL